MTLLVRLGIVAVSLGIATHARAESPADDAAGSYEAPDFIRQPPVLPSSVNASGALRLELRAAVRMAVQKNLGVKLSELDEASSRAAVVAGGRQFEPTITANYTRRDTRLPPAVAEEGAPDSVFSILSSDWSFGVSKRFGTGTTVTADVRGSRAKSSLGNAIEPILFRSDLGLQVTQPLLRGFSLDRDIPRASILRAELASEQTRAGTEIAIARAISDTENAYWDLVSALKNYQVQQSSMQLAKDQYSRTQRQINAGVLPPADLISAESTVAQRNLAMVRAEANIERAADRLREILNLAKADWQRPLLPSNAPRFDGTPITEPDAMKLAIDHRAELDQLASTLGRSALDIRAAKNSNLPQLDLSLRYGLVGQASSLNSSIDRMSSFDARAWTVLVNFSWTPLSRANRADVEVLRAARARTKTQREQVIVGLRREVRDALRNRDAAARQVHAAARFRVLAERSLDADERRFLNGTSSNFVVAQRQDELSQARLAELNAIIGYEKASAALESATGTLLVNRGIQLQVAHK